MEHTICIFVGGRANYGRLFSLIDYLQKDFNVIIIGACSLTTIKHQLKHDVKYWIEGDMLSDTPRNRSITISLISLQTGVILSKEKPSLCICHGDRYEVLGFAIAASSHEIPLMHMEAGEISGMYDNKVRSAISSLSDFCMTPTKKSLKNIINKKAYYVGSPIVDYIKSLKPDKPKMSHVLVMYNPTSTEEFNSFMDLVKTIKKAINIIWINPNVDPGNKYIIKSLHEEGIKITKNVELEGFIKLLNDSQFIIGNTSAGIKEAAVLGVPYLLFGTRQTNRETGSNIIHNLSKIPYRIPYDGIFGNGDTSKKVCRIIRNEVLI